MPSLILTGHPCTGKTSFAHLLAARALRHPSAAIAHVVHIREATACPDQTKAECYAKSHAEKTTRAALKSEFDRAVMSGGGRTLVILDALNYIKGYRYELYCISKATGAQHGVVWITGDGSDASNTSDELAKKRNQERKELQTKPQNNKPATSLENEIDWDGYYEDDGTMDALVLRYEPPDEKNRWENPLYKVDVTHCLPWTKDGTAAVDTSAKPSLSQEEERSKPMASQMQAMEVKDASSHSSIEPKKPARKSGSGFKRRGKKPAPQGATKPPPHQTTTTATPAAAPTKVPSSMASRNLTPRAGAGVEADSGDGSTPNIEDVIDGLLDAFLTGVAPLREGMSTRKHDSSATDMLNQVDSLTQRINGDILQAQAATPVATGVGGKIFVALSARGGGGEGGRRRAVTLSKPLHANDLRAFRRQFLKWIAGHPMAEGTTEEEMAGAYISYIESHI